MPAALVDDVLRILAREAARGSPSPHARQVSRAWKREADAALREDHEEGLVVWLDALRIRTRRGRVPMRFVLAAKYGGGESLEARYVCAACGARVSEVAVCDACCCRRRARRARRAQADEAARRAVASVAAAVAIGLSAVAVGAWLAKKTR